MAEAWRIGSNGLGQRAEALEIKGWGKWLGRRAEDRWLG